MAGKLTVGHQRHGHDPAEVVHRYKSLADIRRGFRAQKPEIEITPVFPSPPQRVKAHASICFMALWLYRVMRQRLKLAADYTDQALTAFGVKLGTQVPAPRHVPAAQSPGQTHPSIARRPHRGH